jgi:uncharacterized protein
MVENVKMNVEGVYLHPNQNVPVVFLTGEKIGEVIPILVGFLEAQAILIALKKIKMERPLTVDLISAFLDKGYSLALEKVVVHTVKNGAFIAEMYIKPKDGPLIKQDARPSDAIAIAMRTGAPIEVSHKVLASRSSFDKENAKALMDYLKSEAGDSDQIFFNLE